MVYKSKYKPLKDMLKNTPPLCGISGIYETPEKAMPEDKVDICTYAKKGFDKCPYFSLKKSTDSIILRECRYRTLIADYAQFQGKK